MFYLTTQWRLRSRRQVGTRWLHLMDSQVALSVLVKGRRSYWKLNRVLSQANALTLAASLFLFYLWVCDV